MKIYVAGTVLRKKLDPSVYETVGQVYHDIESAAKTLNHVVQLPLPDPKLDGLSPAVYQAEIRRRILEADSIITVLFPPNEAVAAEAHLAVEAGKPQAVIIDVQHPPKLSPELAVLERYPISNVPAETVIENLEIQVRKKRAIQKRREEPPPMMTTSF